MEKIMWIALSTRVRGISQGGFSPHDCLGFAFCELRRVAQQLQHGLHVQPGIFVRISSDFASVLV